MKRRFAVVLMLAVLCMQRSPGQDYKKVVDLIADIEGSLKTMTPKEGAPRMADVASLRDQVDHLKTLIAARKETPDSLAKRVAAPDTRTVGAKPPADVSMLALQLSTLLCDLKTTIEEEKLAQKKTQRLPIASPSVQVGGVAYTYFAYSQDGTDGPGANRFDFDRIYLTAKSQLFDGGKFQFTTDVYRNTTAGSYYNGLGIRVKLAYLELALSNPLTLRMGMIPTQWASFIDNYWRYRGVSATIVDRQNYFSSADLGVSLAYALPGKFGEVTGYIFNGGGYTNTETNRFKDVAVRINVMPFPETANLQSFTLAGYVYKGANVSATSTALRRDRVGGMISYAYSIATVTAEYHVRKDALTHPDTVTTGKGVSVFGEVRAPFEELGSKLSLVWRFDVIDPNRDKGADMQRLAILGLSYKMNERVNFVADYQGTIGEIALFKRPDGVNTDADKRWFLHLILTY
jgi:hypothetical protein